MCIVYNCQCLQIIVQFPSPFWRNKMNTPHFFGHVSSSEQKRGLFPVFYDVTEKVRQCVENMVMYGMSHTGYMLVTHMSHTGHMLVMSTVCHLLQVMLTALSPSLHSLLTQLAPLSSSLPSVERLSNFWTTSLTRTWWSCLSALSKLCFLT